MESVSAHNQERTPCKNEIGNTHGYCIVKCNLHLVNKYQKDLRRCQDEKRLDQDDDAGVGDDLDGDHFAMRRAVNLSFQFPIQVALLTQRRGMCGSSLLRCAPTCARTNLSVSARSEVGFYALVCKVVPTQRWSSGNCVTARRERIKAVCTSSITRKQAGWDCMHD